MFIPQAAPRKSFAGVVFTTLAVTLLGCSITLNFWLLVFGGLASMVGKVASSTPGFTTTTLVEGDSTRKVYVLDIVGEISEATETRFTKLLRSVSDDSAARALIVHINTPGGSVAPSDNIYTEIQKFKKARSIPVIITQDGLATSGGYYISVAGDRIFASKTTWTGNIGVIMPSYDLSGLLHRYDVRDNTLVSTGATFKDAGSPTKTEDPIQRAYLQDLMDKAFMRFKEVVVEGRGKSLNGSIDAIANGKVYTADDAKALGLVDDIGTLDDALAFLATKHGLSGPEVVHLEEQHGVFADLFQSKSQTPSPSLLNLDIGGTKVEIPRSALDDVLSPRPMYIWRAR
jgi:protease-4